ncbi:ATP-binding cassette domain-containing protein [Caulobacter segnis]|uniref:ATP-binding cassette domain-containing protein n=1 Tax=Caulobacter segnis TaxID=88688 RepID=UPI001CC13E97|nr:ATP-binding cassette domain-containing protein [Caulobacter segnis]UAL13097.1 ATP-binding cassette domain-containing protein [Caulobacter segnis]
MVNSPLEDLIRAQKRERAGALRLAVLSAVVLGGASTLLLGLSGWFIVASAVAGAAGLATAQAFNVLLPGAMIRLLAILRTAARYGERLSGHAAALRALAAIRPAVFASLAAAPPREALSLSRGEASARLVQDVDAVETRFVRLSAPWSAVAGLLAGWALAALAGWPPALVILAAAGAAVFSARALARRFSAPARATVQARVGALKETTAALVAASAELRAYGLEAWAGQTLNAKAADLDAARLDAARANGLIVASQAAILGAAVAAAVAFAAPAGAPLAALAGLAAAMSVEALAGLAQAFDQSGAAAEARRRLDAILRHAPRPAVPAPATPPSLSLLGQTLTPGKRLAVVGASGCGKTTAIETLLGLGRHGGEDASARAAIAWLPQDAGLIAGTVRENLRLAAPKATDAMLWAVLEDAALADRIRAAPEGLGAWLGDDGERLSGGERRRLALARAYLREAAWLVLDEPTEGLDAATEAKVVERLDARLTRTGQGLVLVSHRPAPTAICGRRVEMGAGDTKRGVPADLRKTPALTGLERPAL